MPDFANVPHLDQFFGIWAIRQEEFAGLRAWASGIDLHLHLNSDAAQRARDTGMSQTATVKGGVAIIGLHGLMLKHQSSIPGSTSTVLVRRQIHQAVDDDQIRAILLHVESGGGVARGATELADDIRAATARKPVLAYIEDVGASAAYFAASQASKVYANAPAVVGGIGTYTIIEDTSGRAERDGIKVHVIRAGAFKGVGARGTKVTDAHLAELQRLVDGHQEFFTAAVARGRNMTLKRAGELADGRIHLAADAVKLGLLDGLATFQAVWESLALGHHQVRPVSAQPTQPAGTPGRSTNDAAGVLVKGRSRMNDEYQGDAIADFDALVREQVDRGKSRQDAVLVVASTKPELHRAYIAQSNERLREQEAARRRRS